jgi:hypothetical protein
MNEDKSSKTHISTEHYELWLGKYMIASSLDPSLTSL